MREYDHAYTTKYTESDCVAAHGKSATLPLTGVIIGSGMGAYGPYVRFQVDARWGLSGRGNAIFGIDLDALEVRDA